MNEAAPDSVVESAGLLVERFGHWPSFHDAEITHVQLDRVDQRMLVRIHVAQMSREVDVDGRFKVLNPSVVELEFAGIDEIELRGFNQQNVVSDLSLSASGERIHVRIDPVFGLEADLTCDWARIVSVEPMESWH